MKDILEDGEAGDTSKWVVHSTDASVDNIYDPKKNTRVIEFFSSGRLLFYKAFNYYQEEH